jgi:uncharacterized protein (DUF427 family)
MSDSKPRILVTGATGQRKLLAIIFRRYIPRKDVDMTQLQRTSHQTYCPYKGECAYYSIPPGGERSVNAVWSYEAPYHAVSASREYLAFYPDELSGWFKAVLKD